MAFRVVSRLLRKIALSFGISAISMFGHAQIAKSQDPSRALLPYDSFSFFEAGLSREIGNATLRFNFLVDQAVIGNRPAFYQDWKTTGQVSTSLETELSNGWNIGATYTGIFVTGSGRDSDHLYAVFVDAPWGRLSTGRIDALIESSVTRKNRVGNATLTAGRGLGELDETGIQFVQTVNAYQIHFAVDENLDAQAALLFAAPVGVAAHSFGLRVGTGHLRKDNFLLATGETEGISGFYNYVLGSLSLGVEQGYQDVAIDGTVGTNTQRFASIGASYKRRRTSLSAEVGRTDFLGQTRRSAAIGLRYDIARGLSGNVGLNYSDAGTVNTWRIPVSLRYEF